MSDIDGFISHCYDLLLQSSSREKEVEPEVNDEFCVCAKLLERSETASLTKHNQ